MLWARAAGVVAELAAPADAAEAGPEVDIDRLAHAMCYADSEAITALGPRFRVFGPRGWAPTPPRGMGPWAVAERKLQTLARSALEARIAARWEPLIVAAEQTLAERETRIADHKCERRYKLCAPNGGERAAFAWEGVYLPPGPDATSIDVAEGLVGCARRAEERAAYSAAWRTVGWLKGRAHAAYVEGIEEARIPEPIEGTILWERTTYCPGWVTITPCPGMCVLAWGSRLPEHFLAEFTGLRGMTPGDEEEVCKTE